MEHSVILSKLEQEYLLGAIEASLRVRELRSYFLWAQGQLQALLPHQVMVCMQFGPDGGLLRAECLHGTVLDDAMLALLMHPTRGLALRLARHGQANAAQPVPLALEAAAPDRPPAVAAFASANIAAANIATAIVTANNATVTATATAASAATVAASSAALRSELRALGLANVLLHGSGALAGGNTCFALFGMPQRPGPRQAYFIELLLPHLHLALLRLDAAGIKAGAGERPCSRREMEILHWVREGKSNEEVGQILGISGLTVKNHLQRIYKTLGVSNRTQAVARGMALRLLDGGGSGGDRVERAPH